MSRQPGKRRTRIGGQFAARLIEMLESPAFRALSLSGHRVLARIEIELAHHGGADNGRLPVTFEDFHRYGIHRHAIGPAIRECVALGFVRVTEAGCAGNAEHRSPNKFKLTYKPIPELPGDGCSHEWRRIATHEEAERIAVQARQTASPQRRVKRGRPRQISVPKTGIENRRFGDGNRHRGPMTETVTTGHSAETITTLDTIDGGGAADPQPSSSISKVLGERRAPVPLTGSAVDVPAYIP